MARKLESYFPPVQEDGINTDKAISTSSTLSVTGVSTLTGGISGSLPLTGALTVTSSSATALVVGPTGTTNPSLVVDASAASSEDGLKVTSTNGLGAKLSTVSADANADMSIDALGTGTVRIGATSTGMVITSRGAKKSIVNAVTLTALGATQNSTPTASQLIGGFISQQSQTAGGTVTFDNGTNISAAIPGVATGDSFTCLFANIGNQTLTFTSATGATVVGTAALATLKNAMLTFVCTGTNTWNVYTTISA